MPEETIKLIDDSEVIINCRFLSPRKAFSLVRKVINISEMIPASIEVTNDDGSTSYKEVQRMVGDFSGIFELMPLCIDEIISDCPQKHLISMDSMKALYAKYCERVISEVMATANPKSVQN